MQGKKSCHTGMGKTAGWVMPISYLVDSKQIDGKTCDFAKELGESQVPRESSHASRTELQNQAGDEAQGRNNSFIDNDSDCMF